VVSLWRRFVPFTARWAGAREELGGHDVADTD
jgi:hypothetical protein